MVTDSSEEIKWEPSDEEEEALSLCDLPVNLVKEENHSSSKQEDDEDEAEMDHQDFNFGPPCISGSISNQPLEMCAADDMFFQGQILPLGRLSISSQTSPIINKSGHEDSYNPTRLLSRSESMDHSDYFTSFSSSRSSSFRSSHRNHSSSSSTNSSASNSTRIPNNQPIRFQTNFLTHPSPKPQIRPFPTTSLANTPSVRHRKSSVWDIFRLGLVRAPDIELQDLKSRCSVSRNSSQSSSVSNSSTRNSSNHPDRNFNNRLKKRSPEKKQGKLLSGCSCTVRAVEPVALNVAVMKSRDSGGNNKDAGDHVKLLKELKTKSRRRRRRKQQKEGTLEKQERKKVMSRHRTFEWVKELSHESYVDHQERRQQVEAQNS